jgi:AmmeMemoRadiSam system protein B
MIRQPAVAGSFYPAGQQELSAQVASLMPADLPAVAARGLIAPHAGYVYSGAVAGELIAGTRVPETVLLLGPNHHGSGPPVSVSSVDGWATPLGNVPLAVALREQLCRRIEMLELDDRAHLREHSLEVMLPFLRHVQPHLQIVPLALRSLALADCLLLGDLLGAVLADWPTEVLLLASSDMNHFLDAETTRKLDALAIAQMTACDPAGLYATVMEHRISMCGVLAAVVVLQAAKGLGATRCRLVRYAHSGEVNHDNSRVVGYAGLSIT